MYMAMGDGYKNFFLVRYSIVVLGSSSVHGGSRLALLLVSNSVCLLQMFQIYLKYSYLLALMRINQVKVI